MEPEIRKLPKKTVIMIATVIIVGILIFIIASAGKAVKVEKILHKLGYTDVSGITVYATQEFLREDINVKGMKYTVSFTNNLKKEDCKGFVLKDYKGNVEEDLLCGKDI
jgi:hypothetical protein